MHTYESATDVILTNCKYNFMYSKASETGLSDFHKMVCTFMRNTYSHQKPIKIAYRDYKGFDQTKLLNDYKKSRSQNPINFISDANSDYDKQISLLQEVLDKHAPKNENY